MKNKRRHQVSLTFLKCLLCILLFGLSFSCTAQEPKTETKPAEKSKAPEDWRGSEKRFLALLKIESFDKTFDANFFDGMGAVTVGKQFNKIMDKDGRVLAVQWIPFDPKLAKLTVEEIRKACGKPSVSFDKEEWWGRLGYVIKEDKTILFQAVRDISHLKKPDK
jgi:hypothetical protein